MGRAKRYSEPRTVAVLSDGKTVNVQTTVAPSTAKAGVLQSIELSHDTVANLQTAISALNDTGKIRLPMPTDSDITAKILTVIINRGLMRVASELGADDIEPLNLQNSPLEWNNERSRSDIAVYIDGERFEPALKERAESVKVERESVKVEDINGALESVF